MTHSFRCYCNPACPPLLLFCPCSPPSQAFCKLAGIQVSPLQDITQEQLASAPYPAYQPPLSQGVTVQQKRPYWQNRTWTDTDVSGPGLWWCCCCCLLAVLLPSCAVVVGASWQLPAAAPSSAVFYCVCGRQLQQAGTCCGWLGHGLGGQESLQAPLSSSVDTSS